MNFSLVNNFLENSALQFPNKTAVICEENRVNYFKLNRMADSLANQLNLLGIKKGDKIILLFNNCVEYIVSYYAILKAGAVAVPLSVETKPSLLLSISLELEAKIIITAIWSERDLSEICFDKSTIEHLIIQNPTQDFISAIGSTTKVYDWNDLVMSSNATINLEINESDLASIIYTSGSTGQPKGVMLSHKNIVANTQSICSYLELSSKDIQMVVLPFFYVMGKSLLNTHFAVGGTVVINNTFLYPATVVKQMIEENVTGFSGVPSTYSFLLHRSPLVQSRDKLTTLRYCSQAGGHMSSKIKHDLKDALPEHTKIFVMYGTTEASARLTYLDPSLYMTKINSIGKAIPNVAIDILNKQGHIVKPHEEGELVASGDNIMQGYWNDIETSEKVITKHGYHTGDLGYYDDEGFLYVTGRIDNMLKVGGYRINPQEIEDIIMSSGSVVDVVIVGIIDKLLMTKLIALVVTEKEDKRELLKYCIKNMPRYKIPSDIIYITSLPKNSNEKIDRIKCSEIAKSKL